MLVNKNTVAVHRLFMLVVHSALTNVNKYIFWFEYSISSCWN